MTAIFPAILAVELLLPFPALYCNVRVFSPARRKYGAGMKFKQLNLGYSKVESGRKKETRHTIMTSDSVLKKN